MKIYPELAGILIKGKTSIIYGGSENLHDGVSTVKYLNKRVYNLPSPCGRCRLRRKWSANSISCCEIYPSSIAYNLDGNPSFFGFDSGFKNRKSER